MCLTADWAQEKKSKANLKSSQQKLPKLKHREKRDEQNISYLWVHIKWSNICVHGVPEREEKDNGYKRYM